MKKQYSSWENHLSQRLQKLEGEPSFGAWERLEADLDRKDRRNWLMIAAAMVVLVSSGGYLSWQFLQETSPQQELAGAAQNSPFTTQENRPAAGEEAPAASLLTPELSAPLLAREAGTALPPAPYSTTAAGNSPAGSSRPQGQAGALQPASEKQPALSREAAAAAEQERQMGEFGETRLAGRAEPPAEGSVSHQTAAPAALNSAEAWPGGKNAAGTPLGTDATQTNGLPSLTARAPDAFVLSLNKIKLPQLERPAPVWEPYLAADKRRQQQQGRKIWTEMMPTWSYRRIEPNTADAVVITSMESQPTFSSSRFGAQTAMGIALPVQKNLQWKTGAFYGFQQQQWSYTYRSTQADSYETTLTRSGQYAMVPNYSSQTSEVAHTLHNMGITSGLSYRLPVKFAANHADARLLTFYNSQQKISSFLTLGYSVGLPLKGGIELQMGPSLQLHLHSSEAISPHFQEKPMVFGIQLGANLNKP